MLVPSLLLSILTFVWVSVAVTQRNLSYHYSWSYQTAICMSGITDVRAYSRFSLMHMYNPFFVRVHLVIARCDSSSLSTSDNKDVSLLVIISAGNRSGPCPPWTNLMVYFFLYFVLLSGYSAAHKRSEEMFWFHKIFNVYLVVLATKLPIEVVSRELLPAPTPKKIFLIHGFQSLLCDSSKCQDFI